MSHDQRAPDAPSSARVYDYLLGGKDNYAVDRAVVEQYLTLDPQAALVARANREFGCRAVRFLADQGVDQFLDLGSGLPTSPPTTHETARASRPDARVVYVDHDPVVVAHSAALRSAAPGTATVAADVRDPDTVLGHPDVTGTLDLARPVAVLLFSVLQSVDDPAALVARYVRATAPGSWLALSHMSDRSDPDAVARATELVRASGFPPTAFRPDGEVAALFDGFDLADPGLVDILDWRPEHDAPDLRLRLVGAVGRRQV